MLLWQLQLAKNQALLQRGDDYAIFNRRGLIAFSRKGFWLLSAFCEMQRLFPDFPQQ